MSKNPDTIFISPQSPDAGLNILKQIRELGIKAKISGNDVLANQVNIEKDPTLFEGLILAQPDFDERENILTKKFIDADKIKEYLNELRDYNGASGIINFDQNGDGIRNYILREITNGKLVKIQ